MLDFAMFYGVVALINSSFGSFLESIKSLLSSLNYYSTTYCKEFNFEEF